MVQINTMPVSERIARGAKINGFFVVHDEELTPLAFKKKPENIPNSVWYGRQAEEGIRLVYSVWLMFQTDASRETNELYFVNTDRNTRGIPVATGYESLVSACEEARNLAKAYKGRSPKKIAHFYLDDEESSREWPELRFIPGL
jgi:hypothetical protein